jgi:hypothetical protein
VKRISNIDQGMMNDEVAHANEISSTNHNKPHFFLAYHYGDFSFHSFAGHDLKSHPN